MITLTREFSPQGVRVNAVAPGVGGCPSSARFLLLGRAADVSALTASTAKIGLRRRSHGSLFVTSASLISGPSAESVSNLLALLVYSYHKSIAVSGRQNRRTYWETMNRSAMPKMRRTNG